MAWPLLCTLPKGQTSELEPLPQYKNASTPKREHSNTFVVGSLFWSFPLLLKSNYSKIDFRGLFGKREIKANASMKSDFSPIRLQIYE